FRMPTTKAQANNTPHRLRKVVSPVCPCCGFADETVDHFLHFCPAHDAARCQLHATNRLVRYWKHLLSDPKFFRDLFIFIQHTRRFHSVFGDFKELPEPEDQ
ncbi:hypothetical protein C8R43DRAFT_887606, partial [Mycena crocata]